MCTTPSPTFFCRFARVAGIPVAVIGGDVDIAAAPALRDALLNKAGSRDYASLILDVSQVTFMDSEGLRVLMGVRPFFPEGVALVGARPALLRMLSYTGADRLFAIVPRLEEARAALKRRPLGP